MCALHGAMFDVITGEVVMGPAPHGLHVFPVKVEGDDVLGWTWSRPAARGLGRARARLADITNPSDLSVVFSAVAGPPGSSASGVWRDSFWELVVAGRLLFSYRVLEGKSRFSKRVCSVLWNSTAVFAPIIRARAFFALCRGDVTFGCSHGRSVEEGAAIGIGGRGRVAPVGGMGDLEGVHSSRVVCLCRGAPVHVWAR